MKLLSVYKLDEKISSEIDFIRTFGADANFTFAFRFSQFPQTNLYASIKIEYKLVSNLFKTHNIFVTNVGSYYKS